MIYKPSDRFERQYENNTIIGIDEVGRGPWAGPLVSACVIYNDKLKEIPGINDSKKLSVKKREELYDIILEMCQYGVGTVDNNEIDQLKLTQATITAMKRAISQLPIQPEVVLLDGNLLYPISEGIIVPIIKGDSQSLSIAAASIVAKVTRDRMMMEASKLYPQYGWENNVGYGTASHQEAIKQHGVTPYHRKSFAPIRKFLEHDHSV